jgi:hypothetical protein
MGQNDQCLSLSDFCCVEKITDERVAKLVFAAYGKDFLELVHNDNRAHIDCTVRQDAARGEMESLPALLQF